MDDAGDVGAPGRDGQLRREAEEDGDPDDVYWGERVAYVAQPPEGEGVRRQDLRAPAEDD